MMTFLLLVALVALGAAIAAWRIGWGTTVIAGLCGLAGAVLVAAWALGPGTGAGISDAPESWLVDSARAFNKFPVRAAPGSAASLPDLVERLAARLAESPDDAAGWSLLAATYRQLGRDKDAAAAEQRAIEAGGDPTVAGDAHRLMVESAGASSKQAAARYVAEGQRLRVQRKFGEAEQAFRKAVEADPGDADSWADLADSAAVAAGHDLTVSRDAIQQALTIDPQHRKALWLRASLELQQRQYAQAATTWRTLSALVPAGSPDARVIAANIAEADALAASSRKQG
jgi:cytochrome c-type biogenesis protein CcmH/NrfG